VAAASEPGYLAFLSIGAYVAVLVATFALARRWQRATCSFLASIAIVGIVFLGWSWVHGISALPGKLVGSPEAQFAFRVGFPSSVLGTVLFVVCLAPSPARFRDGTVKSIVAEFICRIFVTYLLSAIVGMIAYTVVTGYVK